MESLDCETVIVGAGVAGLAAGRILATAAAPIVVLEGRNRVGGRIFSAQVAGEITGAALTVELGAEFIHGLPQELWALITAAGLPNYELGGRRMHFVAGRLEAFDEQRDRFSVVESMTRWAAAHARDPDRTFADYLRLAGVAGNAARQSLDYVEGFNAADANLISVAALAKQQRAEDEIEAGRLFRIRQGYDALPKFLAATIERAGGRILLGRNVQQIDWRPGGVSLRGIDGGGASFCVRARRAVVTVPLGVLHAGVITFTPEPEEALKQARRMAMGPVVRVTLVFSSRFWLESHPDWERIFFMFAPGESLPTWWTPSPDQSPSVTAWVAGPKALSLQRRINATGGKDALLVECLNTLAKLFGSSPAELQRRLTAWYSHDWQGDEFTRGAYSYVPVGALDASERMSTPIRDTLYFAGEHTDTSGHWGTVHGALRSGERAAAQVLA
jgi:monoamine oxidase